MSDQACENTDREIWRGPDEGNGIYYADSIHVTKDGGIGINCGGSVYVKSIREWHRLAGGPLPGIMEVEDLAREKLAIARLRAAVTGEEFEWEIDGGSPFDDVQFLLAAYDRLAAPSPS